MLTTVRSLQTKFKELIPGNYIYYLDTKQFVNSDHSDFDVDFLSSRSKHDLHVFDLSDEPWRETMAERLDELCKRFKLEKYLILSHSLKYNQNYSYPNIIYFPHNYFDPALHWDENVSLKNVKNNNRSYFASCLNRQPRIPRIYNYINLMHRDYRDKLIISIYNLSQSTVHSCVNDTYQNEWLDQWMLDEWEQDIKPFAQTECVNDLDIGNEAYHDAYINIVTETFVQPNELFLTEKVYKPLACGQMFMIFGPTGTVATLRKMGFDTYDDIINHDSYDWITDWKARSDAMLKELDRLHTLDWSGIYQETTKRRTLNSRLFYSGLAVWPYAKEVADRMSRISHQNCCYDQNYLLKLHNIRGKVFEGLPPISHLFNR